MIKPIAGSCPTVRILTRKVKLVASLVSGAFSGIPTSTWLLSKHLMDLSSTNRLVNRSPIHLVHMSRITLLVQCALAWVTKLVAKLVLSAIKLFMEMSRVINANAVPWWESDIDVQCAPIMICVKNVSKAKAVYSAVHSTATIRLICSFGLTEPIQRMHTIR